MKEKIDWAEKLAEDLTDKWLKQWKVKYREMDLDIAQALRDTDRKAREETMKKFGLYVCHLNSCTWSNGLSGLTNQVCNCGLEEILSARLGEGE